MSIFNLFNGGNKQQPAAPTQQQEPNQHIAGNPTVPSQSNTPTPPATPGDSQPESPNVNFSELWKIDNTQQNQAPNFKLDPNQLAQATSNMNFAKSVKQEDIAKIVQGGEEAVGALMNVLNTFGREVFSTSAQFSSHMTETGYNTAQKVLDSGIPTMVKKQLTQNEMFQANPKLRDPALQPLVLAIQSQITQKYPNASPSEVNTMTEQYFTQVVGKSFGKEEAEQQTQKGSNNFDFSSFLS